jgi:protein AroM
MITIGQSPRTDVVPEMKEILGPDVAVMEAGALDGLSLEEVKRFYPKKGDYILCTRMADGTEVVVAKRHVLPRIQQCIHLLTDKGAEVLLFLCTGKFPEFSSGRLFIEPQKIVDHLVSSLLRENEKLGLLIPLHDQVEQAGRSYARLKGEVIVRAASPYAKKDEISRAAKELKKADPAVIVMHCMGYTQEMKRRVREITGKPVILARSFVARTLRELLD